MSEIGGKCWNKVYPMGGWLEMIKVGREVILSPISASNIPPNLLCLYLHWLVLYILWHFGTAYLHPQPHPEVPQLVTCLQSVWSPFLALGGCQRSRFLAYLFPTYTFFLHISPHNTRQDKQNAIHCTMVHQTYQTIHRLQLFSNARTPTETVSFLKSLDLMITFPQKEESSELTCSSSARQVEQGLRCQGHSAPCASDVVMAYPPVLHLCHQGYISTYRLGRQLQTHRRPSRLS